ncbi:hypothetical protein HIM_06256 [Hirsutella minnesotensis 3608]|uniref:FAD/NAD(P)-binding domain-containing protein n=1 Tax=Hirsutella minnesotensis 3608 TaxID=1043627 RepID=A0A0F7ZNS3_9HYPO|nr:hypothetical protein HIM_06256 [Hirsutella minnesotensis 3608]
MAEVDLLDETANAFMVPGSINVPVSRFPNGAHFGPVDPARVATNILEALNQAISTADYNAIARLFTSGGYWRDHLAISWEFRTIEGREQILKFLEDCAGSRDGFRLKNNQLDRAIPSREPKVVLIDPEESLPGVLAFFKFTTVIGSGDGVMRLIRDEGAWKIFTFYTRLREISGHEELTGHRRPQGVEHGRRRDSKNWAEQRLLESEIEDGCELPVLIIGAGQAGLTAAARLKMVGLNALIVDQNERVGDNWRKRYHQLVLHDPVWYDHMPYIPFPPQWPIFTPKDKLAQFFESYANFLELNVWTNTTIKSTRWDAENTIWYVLLERKMPDGSMQARTIRPHHIIQATGHSGQKNQPQMKGMDKFQGDLICHSAEFPGARPCDGTKRAVIVGSCNSAHDIAQDFFEKGYDVTIVQRSSTCVVSSKGITEVTLKGVYDENGPPVDDADMLTQSLPTTLLKANHVNSVKQLRVIDREILDGLEKVGFKVDYGPDGAGLFFKYLQRGGGYYIDVGAAELIADGCIKVRQGQEVEQVLPYGIRLTDGTELPADEIIFATGYSSMRSQTRAILGDEVADRVHDVWGFNEEGEMRTIWQQSGHPGFWLHGGNLALCRFYSRHLALQIKALEEGLYTYGQK